jgi:biopolymer transport protein TolR
VSFGRLERARGARPISDINMTPLIDVMLVLLVIFIITAPLMSTRLPLDLPRSEAASPTESAQPMTLALDREGRLFIGEARTDRAALTERLRELAQARPEAEVLLRADRAVPYGEVAELIGLVQQSGLSRIGFVTDDGSKAPAAR